MSLTTSGGGQLPPPRAPEADAHFGEAHGLAVLTSDENIGNTQA